jgi:hypothetical protein
MATTDLDPYGPEWEVDFVMNDDQVLDNDFFRLARRSNRDAAAIHKGLGQQNHRFPPIGAPRSHNSLVGLTLERQTYLFRKFLGNQETDIMPRCGIFRARVAQTDH